MELIRTGQAAKPLGITDTTVRVLCERKLLQSMKTRGGHCRITRESIDRYLAEAGITPEPTPTPLLPKLRLVPITQALSSVEQRLAKKLKAMGKS